jgi:hypothetical protein
MAATLNGASAAELKALYIEQNSFNIPEATPIYRIFQFRYLSEDIRKEQLTHVRPKAWGDPLENPLLNYEWTEPSGETISLRGVVGELFGQSWTLDPTESRAFWMAFSHGEPAVRVQTTVGKLLAAVMSPDNRSYMLSHFLGRVSYHPVAKIARWVQNSHYTDFLDSLGQLAVLSLMALREDFAPEEEARLVYWHHPSTDNPWVENNVRVEGEYCRVPFDWSGVIDEVVVGPDVGFFRRACIWKFFRRRKIRCPIRKSSL